MYNNGVLDSQFLVCYSGHGDSKFILGMGEQQAMPAISPVKSCEGFIHHVARYSYYQYHLFFVVKSVFIVQNIVVYFDAEVLYYMHEVIYHV